MHLVRSETLVMFGNTLTADEKYSRQNSEDFSQLIKMQLSQNRKAFSQFFIEFLKFKSNLEYFEKKNESHSVSISEITDSKRGPYLNV